jgi:hypothetical protein
LFSTSSLEQIITREYLGAIRRWPSKASDTRAPNSPNEKIHSHNVTVTDALLTSVCIAFLLSFCPPSAIYHLEYLPAQQDNLLFEQPTMHLSLIFGFTLLAVPLGVAACEGECIVGVTEAFLSKYKTPVAVVMKEIVR